MNVDQAIHILENLKQNSIDLANDHLVLKTTKDCCRAQAEAYEQAIQLLKKVDK